ncbi:hypothetical protein BaRGS_00011485 [Batillaria attramentaria]|uniref:Uncharacterized protein n=1 Tax=Batillaria attramentaria TaxID=370345 RepID=A0ABD0LDH1_9CAEN
MCHSAGCDCTLRMLQQNSTVAKASIFLEPYSSLANDPMSVQIPIFSYGTQLSEEGNPPCARPGKDWRQF